MFKKNTAVTGFTVGLVSSTDGSDITTGTPVGYYTLDGGTQTAIGDVTPVHEGNGEWSFDLTSGEMNGDVVGLTFTHASAITAHFTIKTDTSIVSDINTLIGTAGAGLTNINLPNQTMDITGNLSGSVGSVTGAVGSVTGAVGSVTGHTAQTGDTYALANGATGFAAIDTVVDTIKARQEYGDYEGSAIWIDTVNGAAGTTDYQHGTKQNPVDSIADANTLATSLGLNRFMVASGSSITFAAGQVSQTFYGHHWDLALGGQDISKSHFTGAEFTGTGTTATGAAHFEHCDLGFGGATLGLAHLYNTGFGSNLTLTAAGPYIINDCYNELGTSLTPEIDFGAAVAATSVLVSNWSGNLAINNKDATGTDHFSIEGDGKLTISSAASGTINVRGKFEIVNPSNATIVYDDDTQNQIDVLADSNELQTNQGNWLTATGFATETKQDAADIVIAAIQSLLDDARTEPGQGAPPVNPDTVTKIDYLYKAWRNKTEQTATTLSLYDDAGTTVDQKSTVSDDTTTATKGEIVSGP